MFDTSVMECTTSLDLDLDLLLFKTAMWLIQHGGATTQTKIIHLYIVEQ